MAVRGELAGTSFPLLQKVHNVTKHITKKKNCGIMYNCEAGEKRKRINLEAPSEAAAGAARLSDSVPT